MDSGKNTLNNKIERAWMEARRSQPSDRADRRAYQARLIHVIADELDTTLERVRQRVVKIERRELGSPHCATCTCAEITL